MPQSPANQGRSSSEEGDLIIDQPTATLPSDDQPTATPSPVDPTPVPRNRRRVSFQDLEPDTDSEATDVEDPQDSEATDAQDSGIQDSNSSGRSGLARRSRATVPIPSDLTRLQRKRCQWDDLADKDKLNNYWFVHRIVGHKKDPRTRDILYEVKWLGFRSEYNTFEPAKNLDGSISLLKSYHRRHPELAYPDWLKKRVGSFSGTGNQDVWITIDRVIGQISKDLVKIFRNQEPIPVVEFESGLGEQDSLYILEESHHCFVVLYIADKDLALISDDGNKYINDAKARLAINKMLKGVSVQPIEYLNSYYEDECGGGAILIGRELLRLYIHHGSQILGYPASINVPAKARQQVLRREYGSEKLPVLPSATTNISKRLTLRCEYCEWSTNSTSRAGLVAHMRLKHNK